MGLVPGHFLSFHFPEIFQPRWEKNRLPFFRRVISKFFYVMIWLSMGCNRAFHCVVSMSSKTCIKVIYPRVPKVRYDNNGCFILLI